MTMPYKTITTPYTKPRRTWRYLTTATVLSLALLCGGLTGCGLFQKPWWHIYFTDPSQATDTITLNLVSYINNSDRSIHIAAFEFNLTPVADALIAAQKRGVDVKWVTDDEYGLGADKENGRGQFAQMKRSRLTVKADNRSDLMHNKFIIFDSQIVWTGSTNLTTNGTQKNNNNVIVLESPEIATMFEREFAEMWDGQFGPGSPSTAEQQQLTVNGTPIQVLFAPEDNVIKYLVPLIEGANSSIRFMAFSFTNEELGKAVLNRAKAGVDVQGIFETRDSETQYSELPKLYCAKVPVRQDGNKSAFHHKVLVIDKRTVVTGSFNFSNNADRRNDENVAILTNSDIAAEYLKEFDRRWLEGHQPAKAKMKCR